MELGGAWRRWRGRGTVAGRRLVAGAVALTAVVAVGAAAAVAAGGEQPVRQEDRFLAMAETPGSAQIVQLDTSFFTTGSGPRPAVLLGHGFGGSKEGERERAQKLARQGYAVLTWSARGFGRSGGKIGLNAPDREVEDVKHLVDWLAQRPEVRLDGPGDPRVGITGASYGGAVALLGSAYDRRIDAVASAITWWNLADALFPQGVRGSGAVDGVFKKLWSGIFFTTGSVGELGPSGGAARPALAPEQGGGQVGCGRFLDELCRMYDRVATAGHADPEAVALLDRSSPSSVADRLKVPTLVVQGQQDSLFPLDQGDAIARAVAANGAPVAVDWFAGGHDGATDTSDRVDDRVTAWFDHYLKGDGGAGDGGAGAGAAFRVTRTGGVDSTGFQAVLRGATADSYPGLGGTGSRQFELKAPDGGPEQAFANPPGGAPSNISALPGLGGLLGQASALGAGLALDFPGQFATFESAPLDSSVHLTGQPTVPVRVRADRPDAVLFAKLYDVAPDGKQSLPQQLSAPLRVTGADAPDGRSVTVALPTVDHTFDAGHRLRLVLASTDLAYASPVEPATYRAAVTGPVTLPTVDGLVTEAAPLPARTWVLPLVALALAAGLVLVPRLRAARAGRRAHGPAYDPELAGVPLVITGLSKRYKGAADRYAVRDLGFRVERGQVLGLLGPNGAGKTTTLRMLMGLIRPDAGEIRIFGHLIRPGAPVLSRVGAFVEGAGFLPHLTGRANLRLYWQATGRPEADAHLDEALAIAGLGEALDRAVRTYSQGMRQRLAIAQAMLGLPDLLILDEPTNGLDPPQIREMREVMIRYAAAGRTVIVSSHLLAEVEQSCTDLVVMDRGRLVTTGAVAEIVGAGSQLLIGTGASYGAAELAAAADKVAALDGVGTAEAVEGGLLVGLDGMAASRLLAELVRLEVPVESAGPQRRLEDAFLSLIGGTA
ncbi:alpha/beta fold hydrolase [Kitasatospora purpeofusca]|uniref:alpha/beta fold hydrolase n=1 Tax=Kitasatospora purpeofusca TaxID=67352 RepID=UPI0035D73BBE